MAQKLNVIALISGGKDSIYSILHCIQNGHKVVALGNLYPRSSTPREPDDNQVESSNHQAEHDLNSFMYQTVGHTIIHLYEQILGIPLYRQPIIGEAVSREITYVPSTDGTDETESLVPLLKTILAAHPNANALSTGAILSTYQRTRVECVALRLNLEPLSFLWQYPSLPPARQSSLLEDMERVRLEARIIKVASGGLDESFLWRNVASWHAIRDLERVMGRFGGDGDGSVLGEGGEFETLVLDGPHCLFGGRVLVEEEDRMVVREGGGAAYLAIGRATVEMKDTDGKQSQEMALRVPDLLDSRFGGILCLLQHYEGFSIFPDLEHMAIKDVGRCLRPQSIKAGPILSRCGERDQKWMFAGRILGHSTIEGEVEDIMEQMRAAFQEQDIKISDIVSTVITLRSMNDFTIVNKVYGALFKEVNPPSRVTIACGAVLPPPHNLLIHLHLFRNPDLNHLRQALHVQSRSYWAPANIGPYSQAQSMPLCAKHEAKAISQVHIAGQIALVPSTMSLPKPSENNSSSSSSSDAVAAQISDFQTQALLALQHLFRIGRVMHVSCFAGAVAYLSRETADVVPSLRARIAGMAWRLLHARPKRRAVEHWRNEAGDLVPACDGDEEEQEDEEEGERDLWEERHHFGLMGHQRSRTRQAPLPDWSVVRLSSPSSPSSTTQSDSIPAFFAAEVQSLPRSSAIEWVALSGLILSATNPLIISSHQVCKPLSAFSSSHSSPPPVPKLEKPDMYTYTSYTVRVNHVMEEIILMLPWLEDSASGIDTDGGEGGKWKAIRRECLDKGMSMGNSNEKQKGKGKAGYHGADSAWIDVSIAELWEVEDEKEGMDWTGVVPCWSLWDGDGRRLGAVLRFCRNLTG